MLRRRGQDGRLEVEFERHGIRSYSHRRPLVLWLTVGLAFVLSISLPNSILMRAAADLSNSPVVPNSLSPTAVPSSPASSPQGNGSGTPLAPGTVRSVFVPTVAAVDGNRGEPTLIRTASQYLYVTGFGNYTFPAATPWAMTYNDTTGAPVVSWSSFLVGQSTGGLAIPMMPTKATVTMATNNSFSVSYTPLLLGVPQGTAIVQASFSADAPPEFSVNYTQSMSSTAIFNILWVVLPTLPYMEEANGVTVSLSSFKIDTWTASLNDTVVLVDASNPTKWQRALRADWSRTGAGDLYAGPLSPLGSLLGNGFTVMFPADQASIDPTIVATTSSTTSTAYPAERKTFSYDGFYYAFYDNSGIRLADSPDGQAWTATSDPTTGTINPGFDVAQQSSTVAIAWIDSGRTVLQVKTGTLVKGSVNWNSPVTVTTIISTQAAGPVGMAIAPDGTIWVSATWQSSSVYYRWVYQAFDSTNTQFFLAQQGISPDGTSLSSQNVMAKPVPLPDGRVFIVDTQQGSSCVWVEYWRSGSWSGWTCLGNSLITTGEIYAQVSVVSLSNGTIWAAYPAASGSLYGIESMVLYPSGATTVQEVTGFSNVQPIFPTLGADDFDDLYLFWMTTQTTGYQIYDDIRTQATSAWPSSQLLYTFTGGAPSASPYLTSAAHVSGTAFMVYAQATAGNPTTVEFIGMPLPTNLGTSPSQPWSRDGLAPYGTYFQQLSDYVAPGNGLLTVAQTDLALPGRGLNLALSRVFSTPRAFLTSSGSPAPYLYETYSSTSSNLGMGWQFNFPWIGKNYLHLWNGQTYLIQWNGHGVFENHAGEQFVLSKFGGTGVAYAMLTADGTNYSFDGPGRLVKITDSTGQNVITFTYAAVNGYLSSIQDTVGRTVSFSYDGNSRVQSISWSGRVVQYQYDSQGHLIKVLDPMSRATTFTYNQTNQWLLAGVTYPTGGHTLYSYRKATTGEASSYLVALQNVYNGTPLVKSTNFSYDFINGKVAYAKLTISNGSATQGYTAYNFGSPVNGMTTTVLDSSGKQLRRFVSWYTANGAAAQQDAYIGNVSAKTSSTFQALDNWGNVIYTRDALGQEAFSSFGNTNYANSFYSPSFLSTASNGLIASSNFDNRSLSDWVLATSAGSIVLNYSADPASAPAMKVTTTSSSSTVAYGVRSFPAQSGTFVAEGRVRTDPNARQVYFVLQSSTGGIRVYFAFLDGGQMGWWDGSVYHTFASYAAGEWYKIAFEVNVPAGNYNIWVNGLEKYVGATLTGTTGSSINSMRVQSGYVGDAAPIVMYGDDFKVYSSGTLTLNGLTSGTEVEATDVYGNVVAATAVPSGSSSATINSLGINAHDYFLEFTNTTQPIRNGNMETSSGWAYTSTNTNFVNGGYVTTDKHSGSQSYLITLNGYYNAGDSAVIYQDLSGFRLNDTLRVWFEVAPQSGTGGCSGSSTANYYLSTRLSISTTGSSANPTDLALRSTNVVSRPDGVYMPWTQLSAVVTQSSFRLQLRIVADTAINTKCGLNVFIDDVDENPEYSSPTTDLWGGDVDAYTPPIWRTGEFYTGTVPSSLHNRPVGTLTWQNGSLDPSLYFDMQTFRTPSRTDLVNDLSGHGNAGTLFGTTAVTGFAGGARSFNGVSDYISVPDSPSLESSTFSVSFWINPASFPTSGGYTRVLAKDTYGTGGLYRGWIVLFDSSQPGKIYLAVFANTASFQETDSPRVQLVKNVWQQLTFAFDGVHLRAYLNATEVTPAGTMTGTYGLSTNPLLIGTGDNSGFFQGVLDEIRVYVRPLSPTEVQQLASHVLWLDMETTSSSRKLTDMSGYQNAGSVTGTTTAMGEIGKALQFNGTSDYVLVPAPMNGFPSGPLTLSAWVQRASSTAGGVVFDEQGAGAPSSSWHDSQVEVETSGTIMMSVWPYTVKLSCGSIDTHFHLLTLTYDATSQTIACYVDGSLKATGSMARNSASAQTYVIGHGDTTNMGNGGYFQGIIDEVHVLRRTMSASDIAGGNAAKSTPPSRTLFQYNSLGENVETKTYHNGSWLYTESSNYDAYGNLLSLTDPNGIITTYAYSSMYSSAYLTGVTRGSSTQSYAYDFGTGLVTSKTDPRQLTTSYTYDILGRLTSVIRPVVGGATPTTTYVYDDVHDILTVYDPDSLPRNLHYDMETILNGAMEDLSGHGGMGTIYGTTSVTGQVGLARSFNGVSDYIASSFTQASVSTYTISAWVKTTSTGGVPVVEDRGAVGSGGRSLTLEIGYNGGQGAHAGTVNFGLDADSLWIGGYTAKTVNDGAWHHIVGVFTAAPGAAIVASDFQVYVDGAQSVLTTAAVGSATAPVTGSGPTKIGRHDAWNQWASGSVDEVQIFNPGLTAAQVSSIYAGTQPGRYLKTYYDGLGREVRSVQRSFFSGPSTSSYHQETYVDNWQDQVATYVNANGSVYRTTYDFPGRPTIVTNPDGSTRTTTYDDANRIVTMTDEVGRETQDVYDLGGRLVSVRQYYSSSAYYATTYGYDQAGDLLAVTDPLGQTTRHTYDEAGRLVQTSYPDGTTEAYVYDNVGNLVAKTDRGGRTIRYAYDALYRMTTATYPGGTVLRYSYDSDGNVVSVLNGTASLYFAYDALNRLTSQSLLVSGDSTNYTVSYDYDLAGNLLTLTYPDGQGTLTYAYDPFYRVTSMTFGGSTIASFTYRKDDLLSTISYGDGTLATYVFNGRGFPLEDKVTSGSRTLMDLVYTENAAGDVTGITDKAATGDTESHLYDKLDRLITASGPWGTLTYGYDAAGNRLNMALGSTTTYYAYGAYNKLCASSTSSTITCSSSASKSVTKYYYDANGNIVNRVTSSNNSYTFDLDNRLVKAVVGSSTYTLAYDGLGDRIKETGPSGSKTYTNSYVASGGEMLYLKNVVGTSTTKTVYLYAGPILVAIVTGTTTSYFHEDHLGDTRLVTQSGRNGASVVFSTNYEPFGVQYGGSGSDPSVKYTGQWSEAVGLYYNHARYYDPTLGRFVSQDPVLGHLRNPQSLDRYVYAWNNPMNNIDPSGRDCSWNPLSWGECAQGAANSVSNWWNGLSSQDKTAIIIIAIVAVSIVTLGVGGAFLGGALGAAMVTAATGAAVGGIASAAVTAGFQYFTTGTVSLSDVAASFAVGAALGGVAAVAPLIGGTAAQAILGGARGASTGFLARSIAGLVVFGGSAVIDVAQGDRDPASIVLHGVIAAGAAEFASWLFPTQGMNTFSQWNWIPRTPAAFERAFLGQPGGYNAAMLMASGAVAGGVTAFVNQAVNELTKYFYL